ncbi:hypothetical protein LZ32DRAFT_669479 [Colletotrichum eremochloae]|nr:hypothetical protein LZ32DRAFT_669479 [Colletotrichum eremochloae]
MAVNFDRLSSLSPSTNSALLGSLFLSLKASVIRRYSHLISYKQVTRFRDSPTIKLSLLTAAVYAVASVQATCYCYDWHVSPKPPYKSIATRVDSATRAACSVWGHQAVQGSSGLICNGARSLSLANWKAKWGKGRKVLKF